MKFEQAKDVIRHAIEMHRMIEEHFIQLSAATQDKRLKMAADYLVKREEVLQNGLHEYEASAPAVFAETWFKFSACDENMHRLKSLMTAQELQVDDAVNVIVSIYECMVTEFRAVSNECDIDEVSAVFANIADMEARELKKLVRNLQMLNEM